MSDEDLFDLNMPSDSIPAIELFDDDGLCPRCDGKLKLVAENEEICLKEENNNPYLLVACGEYKCVMCALYFISVRRLNLAKSD